MCSLTWDPARPADALKNDGTIRDTDCLTYVPPLNVAKNTARYLLLLMVHMDEVPYGALDLMVLKTLDGFGTAARIRHCAAHRAGGRRNPSRSIRAPSIPRCCGSSRRVGSRATWGMSENNRRARFYSITKAGKKQLTVGSRPVVAHGRDDVAPPRGSVVMRRLVVFACRGSVVSVTVADLPSR